MADSSRGDCGTKCPLLFSPQDYHKRHKQHEWLGHSRDRSWVVQLETVKDHYGMEGLALKELTGHWAKPSPENLERYAYHVCQ